jgi:Fe-S-cluster containining protein
VYSLYQALDNDFDYLLKKISFYRIETDLTSVSREKLVLSTIKTSDGEVIPGLRKINGQNCVFYSKPNCSIYHSRPRACRNYPIAFLDSRSKNQFLWAKDSEQTCPGIGKGKLLILSSVVQKGKITLEEIKAHNDFVNELNTEAAKGKPLSAREMIWMFIVYAEQISSAQK